MNNEGGCHLHVSYYRESCLPANGGTAVVGRARVVVQHRFELY